MPALLRPAAATASASAPAAQQSARSVVLQPFVALIAVSARQHLAAAGLTLAAAGHLSAAVEWQ